MDTIRDQQKDVLGRLTMFVDNSLPKDAENELLQEVNANPNYQEILEKERQFKHFLRSKVHKRKASPSLVQSLMEKIKQAPDLPLSNK